MDSNNTLKSFVESLPPRAERDLLESPLESLFIETLEKYLSSKVKIIPQFKVQTICGNFRLDFLLEVEEKKIAFECDGKEFHDELNDEWRDALILGKGEVDTIYRFKGKDIHTFLNDCIFMIYYFDSELFNERYFLNANQLISDNLKDWIKGKEVINGERNHIYYQKISSEGERIGFMTFVFERKDKQDKDSRWNELYKFALLNKGKTIEELIKLKRFSK